jgi:hypothetical protein
VWGLIINVVNGMAWPMSGPPAVLAQSPRVVMTLCVSAESSCFGVVWC